MSIFFIILGIVCILYCISILLFAGYGTKFFLVWGCMGILCFLWAKYGHRLLDWAPGWLKKLCGICLVAGLALFAAVEGMIISGFFQKGTENLDYIIVLGAQLKENGPSYILQKRLDEAYDYLIANEETMVIVSGGQGSDEPDTEAQGMYEYLVNRGIAPDRIIKEDRSKNTSENIRFSAQLVNVQEDRIGIVTSNFHIFRAMRLAKAAGYQNVYGIAARSHPGLLANNMLREFFGVVKDFLVGNLT